MRSVPAVALATALAFVCATGCKSAETLRHEADDDVRALVESRRAKLALEDGSFTIAPPEDSLRQRILRGELQRTEPLSLVAVLEVAAENSREYQRRKEALYLSALDLTLERWNFGYQYSADADARVDGTGDEADATSGGAHYRLERLLGNGATIAADIGFKFFRFLTFDDGHGVNPAGDLGLTFVQPFLRGSSRAIVLEPLTQAERDLVYAVRTFERFRRGFAVDVATRYYQLAQQADVVANQEFNFQSLVALRERNEQLALAGRLSDIDVGQARQDELRSKDSLLQARERYANQEDEFKLFLGLPMSAELAYPKGTLAELSALGLTPSSLDETHSVAYALENRLDHQNITDMLADSERKVRVAADALRAGFKLTADARATGEVDKPFEFDFQKTTWSLAAELDLPVDQLPERNTYRQALIAFDVAVRQAEQSADQIRADLREELRGLASQASSFEIQQNAVRLAERRIESTRLKLEAGRADTRDLLEAQRDLLDAQNSATSALVEYTLGRLAFYRDLELLRVDEQGLHADEAQITAQP